jgi:LysM repeat protein
MSVSRAEELPEPPAPPAASPQDSARTRAAARWTGPDQAVPTTAIPDQAVRPEPLPAPAARTQAMPPHPARRQPATVPLRLTRRGRVVVAVAATLLLAALSLVIATSAQATGHPVPSRATHQSLTQVTVGPGQSLWSVAEDADPGADTRVVIQQIIKLNGLTGTVVFAGQQLWVPRG